MKKARSDPQRPSHELNSAGVLVMGSFLDQTAQSYRSSEGTECADRDGCTLTSTKPTRPIFRAHHPRIRWNPMGKAPTEII